MSKTKKSQLFLRKGSKTVVITGAGLSKSIGLPLQKELLNNVVPPDILRIHNVMMGRAGDSVVDTEEFLSRIDFEDKISHQKIRKNPRLNSNIYLSGFAAYLYDGIDQISKQPSKVKTAFWRKLADLIEYSNSFITLNWDPIIEIQVRASGYQVMYGGKESSNYKLVLKLHGSMDWYKVTKEDRDLLNSELFEPLFRGYVRYKPLSEETNFLMLTDEVVEFFNKSAPAMIAPTHIKSIEGSGFNDIWWSARNVLGMADQMIIIGYSLPPADTLVRLLLRMGINHLPQPEIIIIDPDPTGVVESRYYDIFGDKLKFINSPFLDVEFSFEG